MYVKSGGFHGRKRENRNSGVYSYSGTKTKNEGIMGKTVICEDFRVDLEKRTRFWKILRLNRHQQWPGDKYLGVQNGVAEYQSNTE